jgi:NAD-dependent SIR2 family protein deacetylase
MKKANPTKSHLLLNEVLEQLGREGRRVSMVTENIDNYHQQVQESSKKTRETYQYPIYGMHGNVLQIKCDHCSYEKEAP